VLIESCVSCCIAVASPLQILINACILALVATPTNLECVLNACIPVAKKTSGEENIGFLVLPVGGDKFSIKCIACHLKYHSVFLYQFFIFSFKNCNLF